MNLQVETSICRPSFTPRSARSALRGDPGSGTLVQFSSPPSAEALDYDLASLRDFLIGTVTGRARGLKSTRGIEGGTLSGTAKAVPLQNATKRHTPTRVVGALLVWLAVCGTSLAVQSGSPAVRKQQARTQFETAERMREALNGRPENERTRRDYQKVADAYRKVYYVSPASSKADASVVAVAEILAEMGRQFSPDEKDLHAAIGQYEFLRREYPGSKYRVEALFTIGQIYKEDLGDEAEARATFEEFLKHYPRNQLAPKAQEALAELNQPKAEEEGGGGGAHRCGTRGRRCAADGSEEERLAQSDWNSPLVDGRLHPRRHRSGRRGEVPGRTRA